MSGFIDWTKNTIYRDIKAENESKDFMVQIRIFSLLDAAVCLIYAFVLGFNVGVSSVIISLLFAVANIAVLIMTYRTSSRTGITAHSFLLILFTLVYCLLYGNKLGLRFSVFTLIPLSYYRVDINNKIKAIFSSFCALMSLVLGIVAVFVSAPVRLGPSAMIFLVTINTIHISLKFIIISLFYYRKFAEGESKIYSYSKKLELLADQDALTRLANRRGILKYLDRLVANFSTTSTPFCISICDIDFFKKVNDTYGHDAGDYILTELADILRKHMKDKGNIARWGGEEFLLVFEGLNGDYVYQELEQIRWSVQSKEFIYNDIKIDISMTFGLEEYDSNAGLDKIIAKADEKLYKGKNSGRNCVIY